MFKKKKKKRSHIKKEKKLKSEAVAPKLQAVTIVYAIFVLSPGIILGTGRKMSSH